MKTCIAMLVAAATLACASLPEAGGDGAERPPATTEAVPSTAMDFTLLRVATRPPPPVAERNGTAAVNGTCAKAAADAADAYWALVHSGAIVDQFFEPECTGDGTLYARRQCTTGMWTSCWCAEPTTGEAVEGTRARVGKDMPVDCDNVDDNTAQGRIAAAPPAATE